MPVPPLPLIAFAAAGIVLVGAVLYLWTRRRSRWARVLDQLTLLAPSEVGAPARHRPPPSRTSAPLVARLRSLVEAEAHPAYVCDLAGRILHANAAFTRLMGQPAERVHGQNVVHLLGRLDGRRMPVPTHEARTPGTHQIQASTLRGTALRLGLEVAPAPGDHLLGRAVTVQGPSASAVSMPAPEHTMGRLAPVPQPSEEERPRGLVRDVTARR